MAQTYDDSSIDMLIGAERIRRRPASMLGSSGLDGARHGFTEIYGNALDEASSGFGNKLEVKYYTDGSISIRDYGRGVPLGWNEKRKNWNWHIIYNELYGGGKYNNGQWYLRSIDNWSDWNINDKEIVSALKENFGITPKDVPNDGNIYRYEDIELKRDDTTIYVHVNSASWATATWEFLNERLNYLASVGLNGLGAASTQYTSAYFIVKSYRNGVCTTCKFEHGMPVINGKPVNMFDGSYDVESYVADNEPTSEEDGTFIHWLPDNEVFSDVNVGGDWLFETCQDIAGVAGIDLHFVDETAGVDRYINAGTLTTLAEKNDGKLLLDADDKPIVLTSHNFGHGNTNVEGKPFVWVCKVDVALAFTKTPVQTVCYHNSVRMKGGAQYEGVLMAINKFFADVALKQGVKLEPSDYESIFAVVVSSYSNYASFRNQTKDEVDDSFIRGIVYQTILDKLNMEYGKGNKQLTDATERVISEAQTRIAIRQAAKEIREAKKVTKQKDPEKFHTCKAYMHKDYSITELWITEGDSAQGAVDKARNSDFQATFPVRGKCLNVLKSSLDKILKNEEIKGIFSLLGTGMDIGHENLFEIDKLKFDKIIFATDADEDGFQIRVLLFLIFYKLAPQLLIDGHVYIAETPRFEIILSTGDTLYAKDDEERDKIIEENGARVRTIKRFKGLGEVNADVLRKTTVHPDTRNLVPITVNFQDENERELIDALFGADKYCQRKKILTTVLGEDVANMMEENALLINEIENSDIDEGVDYQVV